MAHFVKFYSFGLKKKKKNSSREENGRNPMDRGTLAGYSPWGCKRVGHDLVTKQQAKFLNVFYLKTFCMSEKGYIFLHIQSFIIHEIRTQIDCQKIAKGLNLD